MPKPSKRRRSVSTARDGWTGRFSSQPLANDWGVCDFTKKEIVISTATLKEGNVREIIMHEMLHKLFPWLDEEYVLHGAKELDYALDQLLPDGY